MLKLQTVADAQSGAEGSCIWVTPGRSRVGINTSRYITIICQLWLRLLPALAIGRLNSLAIEVSLPKILSNCAQEVVSPSLSCPIPLSRPNSSMRATSSLSSLW